MDFRFLWDENQKTGKEAGEKVRMAATLRIRLNVKIAVGPLHPTGNADVFLNVSPEEDGTARVDITRIAFINNVLFTAIAGVLKERMTSQINELVKEFWRDLPKYIPRVEKISILEIGNDSAA